MNESPDKSHYNAQFLFDSPIFVPVPQSPPRKRFSISKPFIAGVLASALVGGVVGAAATFSVASFAGGSGTVIVNNQLAVNWVTAAAAKASPSVVTISVSGAGASGSGSGVVLSSDGYILTNTHVVTLDGTTGSPSIEVKTADDKVFKASLVGTDPTNDLAVIKITPIGKMIPASFGEAAKLNVGDSVVAIGAPLGLDATVTSGIISSLHRTIQVASAAAPENGGSGTSGLQFWNGSSKAQPINLDVIQTDAAINPGNSGGALVNAAGEVVGINVAIATASSSSTQSGSIGVGFAIPAEIAQRIANEIITSGSASHGLLGALVSDAQSSEDNSSFSVGAKIEELGVGGPADKAGLKVGDVVTMFNGKPIESASELTAAVRQQPAGAKVTVVVDRAGQKLSIQVTLGNANDLKPTN